MINADESIRCVIGFFGLGLTVMKATLRGLFKSYGEVLDVVAHSNLRMRGQAFVSFASVDHAKKALKDVQRFPLYSKPMVCPNLLRSGSRLRLIIVHIIANLVCEDAIGRRSKDPRLRAFRCT